MTESPHGKILVSSIRRYEKINERTGFIFVVDPQSFLITRKVPFFALSDNHFEREHRGYRGMCVSGESIYVASNDFVIEFDFDFCVKFVLRHPRFRDIHGITEVDGILYVVCTGEDSVLAFDKKGNLVNIIEPYGAGSSGQDKHHLNTIYNHPSKGIVVMSAHDSELISARDGVRFPIKISNENFDMPHDIVDFSDSEILVNDTNRSRIVKLNLETGESSCFFSEALVPDQREREMAKVGWLRGLARINDMIYASSTPAKLYEIELDGTLKRQIPLSYDVEDSPFDIKFLMEAQS